MANTEMSLGDKLKKGRRKRVKRFGKNLIRSLADFLGRQSLVGDMPIHDNKDFPFLKPFVDNWEGIRAEIVEILKHREAVPLFQDVSPDQMRIAKGNNWRTFILFGFGDKLEKNCKQAPLTTKILESIPNLQTAWFSILGPGYHIPAHRGVTKGILRSHLGLIIPKDAEKCRIRVGDKIQVWRPGEIFVFDDTYDHEVWNDTTGTRVVLLVQFERPLKNPGKWFADLFLGFVRRSAFVQEARANIASWNAAVKALEG